ncbi:50S ribosomal protein L17 [Candidatus Beckwithbacteria bacterium RBG_13_42_9]|uniref:Large ribosomal subunit protein bL17 n=1 Tax=Candidatus Beckwithbacteria bacterium RBG_13_42_9 TaxID=1797457 RepID=A0A1F5E994_9BACT|nr:MAG: 50S ribosomal protein L17 [Candidatus Beckwithbacteria bacterium RBG_13_42_9]
MRHHRAGKKLNRDTNHRKALFKNLIQALIIHEKIETTEAKAKVVKPLIDRLVSKARQGSLHVRRQLLAFLPSKKAAQKLIDEIAPRFGKQGGGFTKLVRLGRRRGDNSMMVELELTKSGKEKSQSVKEKTITKS